MEVQCLHSNFLPRRFAASTAGNKPDPPALVSHSIGKERRIGQTLQKTCYSCTALPPLGPAGIVPPQIIRITSDISPSFVLCQGRTKGTGAPLLDVMQGPWLRESHAMLPTT